MSEISSFRRLLEMSDKIAREELGDYYIIASSRMDNMLDCLENGAKEIAYRDEVIAQRNGELTTKWDEIDRLTASLAEANREIEQYEAGVADAVVLYEQKDKELAEAREQLKKYDVVRDDINGFKSNKRIGDYA